MPLFDWKCNKDGCEFCFEESITLKEVDEDKKVKCPRCGTLSERLITNPKHYQHVSWSTWSVGHNKRG